MTTILALIFAVYASAKVEIEYDKTRGGVIRNDTCFVQTITVNGADFEVPAKSEKAIGAQKWGEWKWFPGTKGALLPRKVRSPLKNKTKYDQGPGTGVHTGNLINGYDFYIPEGSNVYAVDDGLVVKVVEHFTEAHQDLKRRHEANEIEILHADGSVARYVHLKPDGAEVKVCGRVVAGQLLGQSGNTGYSQGPHLHFEIYRPTGASQSMTISLHFEDDLPSK